MAEHWQTRALRELLALKTAPACWPYRKGSVPAVEPTVLAGWALLAAGAEGLSAGAREPVESSAQWLTSLQAKGGSLGIAQGEPSPGWTTPYGLLLWQALGGFDEARRRAVQWLLRTAGKPVPLRFDPDRIVGHDTTLIGWPWVVGTHSWLEPTAMALLALRREGLGTHRRVREGERVILDRAIEGGGWNYGNKAAFGHVLRPQPAPTGQALLALAQVGHRGKEVDEAVAYLKTALSQTRAPASLGWGLLGLRAWCECPADFDDWLAESYQATTGRPDAAPRLAVLLLAAGERALEIFDAGERNRHAG